MAKTHTGSIPIGIRCNCTWQSDPAKLIPFVQAQEFEAVDIGPWTSSQIQPLVDAGIEIGSVDLPQPWGDLTARDTGKRDAAVDACVEYVKSVYDLGARVFFVCVFQEDSPASRKASMDQAIGGYGRLCELLAALPGGGAKIVMEGWPGPAPRFPVLACTPEGYRGIIQGTGAKNLGVNFDPSHLIRMNIDCVRFLEEFIESVFHAHAKDTEIFSEGLYEYGTLQEAIDPPNIDYGENYWRYTIPGHGCARWGKLLTLLETAGYGGKLCIELEDGNFNGTEETEKRGFIASRDFLVHV